MTIEPSAFWSYVRKVDEHDGGNLSKLREKLAGELHVQSGKNFEIFQDREDIKWGQQWEARIISSINATTFFIPVITPGFFSSTACQDELKIFLNREKDLQRDDLILPLYYITTPEIGNQENDLAKVIAARNWFDFRSYRHEPLNSPEVRKLISQMASQIVEAVHRTPTQNPAKSNFQKVRQRFTALKMEFEDVVESGEFRDAQIKMEQLKSVVSEWRRELLSSYQPEDLKPLQEIVGQINSLKSNLKHYEPIYGVTLSRFLQTGLGIFEALNSFCDSLQ